MGRRAASLLLLSAALGLGCARRNDRPGAAKTTTTTTSVEEKSIVVEPYGPPPPPASAKPLRVLVGGDLIPHRPSLVAPSALKNALAPLAATFRSADMVVANYEAATGEVDKKAFRLAYAAPASWLEDLPHAGVHSVTVANNHACDLDYDGVDATLAAASRGGTIAIGGDPKDPWQARAIVERSGKRICAVAWTTLINAQHGCARTAKLAVAKLGDKDGRAKVVSALARARSWCDATIAIVHGGQEYVPQTKAMIEEAKHVAESGADAIVIHHPHIASPVTVHPTKDGRKVPIFASVGNLVSNQGESWKPPMFPVLRENRRLVCVNGWTRLGVLADLAFTWTDEGKRLDWGFHLLWTENEHANDKTVAVPKIEARLLDPQKDADIVSRLSDDEVGPVDLFEDSCWIEKPLYAAGDAKHDERCTVTSSKLVPVVAARDSHPAPPPKANGEDKPTARAAVKARPKR